MINNNIEEYNKLGGKETVDRTVGVMCLTFHEEVSAPQVISSIIHEPTDWFKQLCARENQPIQRTKLISRFLTLNDLQVQEIFAVKLLIFNFQLTSPTVK